MFNTSAKEIAFRTNLCRRLLGGEKGTLKIDNKNIPLRISRQGILIGVGRRHRTVRINPSELKKSDGSVDLPTFQPQAVPESYSDPVQDSNDNLVHAIAAE